MPYNSGPLFHISMRCRGGAKPQDENEPLGRYEDEAFPEWDLTSTTTHLRWYAALGNVALFCTGGHGGATCVASGSGCGKDPSHHFAHTSGRRRQLVVSVDGRKDGTDAGMQVLQWCQGLRRLSGTLLQHTLASMAPWADRSISWATKKFVVQGLEVDAG